MTEPKVAVLTVAHGRHQQLTAQMVALSQSHRRPDLYLVAAMDDPDIPDVVERCASPGAPAHETRVLSVPARPGGLPVARSRNAVAAGAIAAGTSLLIFLDVDCLPSPDLVGRYEEAATAVRQAKSEAMRPTVLAGSAHHTATTAQPGGPAPAAGRLWAADDPLLLFCSLSFAVSTQDWLTLGGFDEGYEGYGAEDVDFAMRLAAHDGQLLRLAGASCAHEHHDVEDPPWGHLADVVDNSNRFHAKWGFFPMAEWLSAFAANGLIRRTGSPPRWHLTEAGHRAVRTS